MRFDDQPGKECALYVTKAYREKHTHPGGGHFDSTATPGSHGATDEGGIWGWGPYANCLAESAQSLLVAQTPAAVQHTYRRKNQADERLVGASALWCSSALHPETTALYNINRLQTQFIVWMLKLKKKNEETDKQGSSQSFTFVKDGLLRGCRDGGVFRVTQHAPRSTNHHHAQHPSSPTGP